MDKNKTTTTEQQQKQYNEVEKKEMALLFETSKSEKISSFIKKIEKVKDDYESETFTIVKNEYKKTTVVKDGIEYSHNEKVSSKTEVLNKDDFVAVDLKDLNVLPEDVTFCKQLINNDLKSKMRKSL